MKKILLYILLFFPIITIVSCVRGEDDYCPPDNGHGGPGLWITFNTLNPILQYTEEVKHLTLYFYRVDEDGDIIPDDLVMKVEYQPEELRPGDMAAYVEGLPPGNYHLVAIVNDGIYTNTKNAERYETITTSLSNEVIDTQAGSILAGETALNVEENAEQEENVTLLRPNNNIRVIIKYGEGYELPEGMMINAHIHANNSQFDYGQHNTNAALFADYLPWDVVIDDATGLPVEFDLSTMSIHDNRNIMLYVEEVPIDPEAPSGTGRQIAIDFISELAKITDRNGNHPYDSNSELEACNDYMIEITLDSQFNFVSVEIITDWNYNPLEID